MAAAVLKYLHRSGLDTAIPTSTRIQSLIGGPTRFVAGQLVLSSTAYATGGIAADLTQDLGQISCALLSATGGYQAEYDATNKKIKLYTTAGTEVTDTTATTCTVHFLVLGTL